MDTAWLIQGLGQKRKVLDLLCEREKIFSLLPQTIPERLNQKIKSYTIDPKVGPLPVPTRSVFNALRQYFICLIAFGIMISFLSGRLGGHRTPYGDNINVPPIGPNSTWCTPFILEKDNISKSCKVQYTTQEYHIDTPIHCKKRGGFIFPGEAHRSPDVPPHCKILVRTLIMIVND